MLLWRRMGKVSNAAGMGTTANSGPPFAGHADACFFVKHRRLPVHAVSESFMHITPIMIILAAVVLIGLIWAALRITIKRDRATIAADMDEPHEIEKYDENWKGKG